MAKSVCLVALSIFLFSLVACGRPVKDQASGVPGSSSPEPPSPQKNFPGLKTAAESSANAMVLKDYNTVADFTYSKLVKLMGGREETVSTFEQEMKQLESEGMTLVSISVGEPEEVKSVGNQLLSIVPTTLKMRFRDSTIVGQSFLIAVSEDGGNKWTFVDGSIAEDKRTLRKLFPYAANKLQLPPKKQPVIHPNE
jgi:hypothetical protein